MRPTRYLLFVLALALSGCGWDGHFSILGYTTRPNYDPSIRTVYVPIFQNVTLRTTTERTLEFEVTKAVIREIEQKTPYKVVDSPSGADTELIGRVLRLTKTVINTNQLGENRDTQVILTAEVVWRDLRPGHMGEILSAPRGSPGAPPGGPPGSPTAPPGTPGQGLPPAAPPGSAPGTVPGALGMFAAMPPVTPGAALVTSYGTYQTEIGGSISSAQQVAYNNLAVQIISMMEVWPAPPPCPPPGP